MSPHSQLIIAVLFALFMENGLSQATSLEQLRIKKDTRNIPSNMFKPVGGGIEPAENNTAVQPGEHYDSFSERSTAEARPMAAGPSSEEYDERFQQSGFNPQRFNTPPPFYGPSRIPFNPNFPTSNYDPRAGAGFIDRPIGSSFQPTNFGSGSFHSSSSRTTRLRPSSQTVPLMAGNFGYTPSSMGGFGGGPSGNNFYRSESYSYSSDGSGPPQIEQNVFDSRLGHHGISNF